MPYEIKQDQDRWKVVNADTGEVKGEHLSEAKAKAQVRALYANAPPAEKEIVAADLPGVNLIGQEETTEVEKAAQVGEGRAVFIPITKVDLERREVWGYASIEEPDHSGEIMDYASSKPHFVEWSDAQKRRSNGQSLGNLRSMHDKIAAGKLIAFNADDQRKGFYVGAKVVDNDEWRKVSEGVYTGFSIGGSYIRRWPDAKPGLVRYTAGPGELSLVDAPCVESATFDVVKADGTTYKKSFIPGGSMDSFEKAIPAAPEAITDVPLANTDAVYNEPDNPIDGKATVVERMADPLMAKEVDPASPMTAEEAAKLGAPAVDVSADAEKAKSASPAAPVSKERHKMSKPVSVQKPMKKGDPAEVLAQVRQAVDMLQSQAKDGPIDGALLDQVSAMLNVSMDTAPASGAEKPAGFTDAGSAPVADATEHAIPEAEKADEPKADPLEEDNTMTDENVSKGAPATYRPPTPSLIFDHAEEMRADLGKFVSTLERGDLYGAQKIAGGNGPQFDAMFNMATRAIMTEGGMTSENAGHLQKFSAPAGDIAGLRKSITAASIPGVYLMRLAKLMMPLYAGIRNRLPVQTPTGMGSDRATWKAQLGFSTALASMMSVSEGNIGTAMAETFSVYEAPYRDTTANNSVTLKAIAATRGYDDPFQVAILQTMTALLQMEERNLIGSTSGSIAAPVLLTATGSTAGGTIAAGSYIANVTALTYYGWYAASTGSAAAVVPVGETTGSSAASITTSGATSSISLTWSAVPGAVAYNVYLTGTGSAAAAAVYVKTVKLPKAILTENSTAGGNIPPTANVTANAYGYEGIISWCERSTVYGNSSIGKIAMTDMAGAGLTAQAGGIKEIDAVLASMWDNWQIAPTLLLMGSSMAQSVKQKLATGATGNFQMFMDISQNQGGFTGGIFPSGYTNNYAPYANGLPRRIDIIAHPYMPDGSIQFLCETIPFPMSREARGFTLENLVPYTYFPLAQTAVSYPFAMTTSETLACFLPSAQTSIVGIDSAA